MGHRQLAEIRPGLPAGYDLLHFAEIDSTNAEALRQAAAGTRGPLWILADRQNAGRGRRGRAWVSQSGNLFCTLLIAVSRTAPEAATLSFVAALSAADTICHFAPNADIQLKWPNDVLFGGKKIVGILLESATSNDASEIILSIGIGINLQSHPTDVELAATSLRAENIEAPTPDKALAQLAQSWAHWFTRWQEEGFSPIRDAWLARAKGVGQDIQVRLPNETLEGVFKGLDASGTLLLELGNGTCREINAGEVYFGAVEKNG